MLKRSKAPSDGGVSTRDSRSARPGSRRTTSERMSAAYPASSTVAGRGDAGGQAPQPHARPSGPGGWVTASPGSVTADEGSERGRSYGPIECNYTSSPLRRRLASLRREPGASARHRRLTHASRADGRRIGRAARHGRRGLARADLRTEQAHRSTRDPQFPSARRSRFELAEQETFPPASCSRGNTP
jgi:hypothetical protein